MKLIDLTQTIVNRMQVYPGDEPPMLHQIRSLEFDGFTNYQLIIGMHTGTHIDGPLHMVDDKRLISDIPLDCLIGKACVIDIRNHKVFDDAEMLKEKAIGCMAVLFYTGYGELFGTPQYLSDYPLLGENAAQALVDLGIKLIGIDTLTPDAEPYATHKILLGNGILIAENLTNLEQLLSYPTFTIVALPLKIEADSAPARIVAMV